jgi:hypothetical protein
MRFALVLNLLGTLLLFFSFQATSSNVRIVKASDGETAFCVDNRALMVGLPNGGVAIGLPRNPICSLENSRAIAVVNIEHPILVTMGFLILSAGFLLQFLSIPTPKTIAQLRKELKELQKEEQAKQKLNPHTKLPHSK